MRYRVLDRPSETKDLGVEAFHLAENTFVSVNGIIHDVYLVRQKGS